MKGCFMGDSLVKVKSMKKEELKKWIEKNEKSIKNNEWVIKQAQEEIEFGRLILEEIKKIEPED